MTAKELKKCIPADHTIFSTLDETEQASLAAWAAVVRHDAQSAVFTFNEPSDCMFLVLSGEISVIRTDGFSDNREIARVIAGDALGEIELITGIRRPVSAIAAVPSALLRFPAQGKTFDQFRAECPGAASKILYALITEIAGRTRRADVQLKENSPHTRELRRQVYEDKLTNLANRTFLEEQLPEWLEKKPSPISLLMFKPDNFKEVNDRAGHDTGDRLLVYLARLLPGVCPPDSLLVRYQGNEYALVLVGTGGDEAMLQAEKIRNFYNNLDISRFVKDPAFHLTVSIGIAQYPDHAPDAASLIERVHPLALEGRAMGGNFILYPQDVTGRYHE